MGYSHTLHPARDLTPREWQATADDVRQAIAQAQANGLAIVDGTGAPGTEPLVDDRVIRFNGALDPDHGYETFEITRDRAWNEPPRTTKTARQPYDRVVVAALCLIAHHAPAAVRITSNGGPEAWQDGLALARRVRPQVALPREIGARAA